MDEARFREELLRFSQREYPYVMADLHKVVQAVESEIAGGAGFVGWAPSLPDHVSTSLVVTTRSVVSVKAGVFRPKINWLVPLSRISDVGTARASFNGYWEDRLYLDLADGSKQYFTFGFFGPSDAGAALAQTRSREMAARIADLLAPAASTDADSGSDSGDPVKEGAKRFLAALSGFVGPDAVGRPFGEDLGLEQARSAIRRSFAGMDQARAAGFRLAVSLVAERSIGPDDLHLVMGIDSLDRAGLTADQRTAAGELSGAAMTFLGQLDREGAHVWELWKRNDEVAEEFLAWHMVAWGRLTTLGRVIPL